MAPRAPLAGLLALLVALPASAALEGPGMTQRIPAARTATGLEIDGRLDEPAWAGAPVFDAFVQLFPQEGAPPGERTELRVLYDDRNVYVGIVCYDRQPEQIGRALGRRDNPPASDTVQVLIDPAHDHRSAYAFGVNAAGVQLDGLWYADNSYTAEWDAVWSVAVAPRPDGWSAEFAIPLHLLRFPAAAVQTWGFAVQRHIARTHEDISSVLIPRSASGQVSRFGHLTGMSELHPHQDLELLPYAAARTVLRPQFSDPATPTPRLLDPSLDLGLDLKAALSSDVTLNATVNPDFGQVEADQLILNLTNFEPFFPEKRPFFTQGMDIFQPVGAEDGFSPQMLFYSRRIGLTSPILAAAKVTGTVGGTTNIGVLDALVMGPGSGSYDETTPDRRVQLHPSRPLHLGPNDELPTTPPVPQNFFVGVARQRLGENAAVGEQVASATPLIGTCSETDVGLAPSRQPLSCSAAGGNAAAMDWLLRTPDSQWTLLGQVDGSQTVGGPPTRVLRDGTLLHRGDTGLGAYVQGGKVGGEPFRFDLRYRYASPTLELNPVGYLATQNTQSVIANAGYTRPSGFGVLHAFDVKLNGGGAWTADGRGVARESAINLTVSALLPGFHFVELDTGYYTPGYDIREVSTTGIPLQRIGTAYVSLTGQTDANRPLAATLYASLTRNFRAEAGRDVLGHVAETGLTFRPEDRLETKLLVHEEDAPNGPRWVDEGLPGQYLFGDLRAHILSVTLRQQLVLTPRLTLQLYGQLFTDYGLYGPFYTASSQGRSAIHLSDLVPTGSSGNYSFHESALNVNVVLRWEYRPGSTLYLVYARSQRETPLAPGQPVPGTLLPVGLSSGPATDAFLVKWSWWWGP